ncbi:hypothetical protein R1flu_000583 [Riccia fluitans]|uniref:Uncharacterized protein n=1 Tax=Riccia fluitans TaxID=41844 RepID=A0ABD1Y0V6_9MARC
MAHHQVTPFTFADLHPKLKQTKIGMKWFLTLVPRYKALQLWQSRRSEDPSLLGIIVHMVEDRNAIDLMVLLENLTYCHFVVNPKLFKASRSQATIGNSLENVPSEEVTGASMSWVGHLPRLSCKNSIAGVSAVVPLHSCPCIARASPLNVLFFVYEESMHCMGSSSHMSSPSEDSPCNACNKYP